MNWIMEIEGKRWNLTPCLRTVGDSLLGKLTLQQFVLDPDYPNDLRHGKWVELTDKPKVGLHVDGVLSGGLHG